MAEGKRINLPSGGWWAIRTRPTWEDTSAIGEGEDGGLDRFLVALTEEWSFEETVSLEALARVDESDMGAVLQVVHEKVLPWLNQESPVEMAKGLFAGLATGQLPGEFFDIQIMAATGWSWQALQSAPADVVLRMAVFLAVSQVKEQGGALQFPPDTNSTSDVAIEAATEGDGTGDK